MDKKTIIFGLAALILFLVVILSMIYIKPSKPVIPPIQVYSPSPTPITPPIQTKRLVVVSVNPPEDTSIKHFPIRQIEFNFSDQVGSEEFFYTVSPEVKTYVRTKLGTNILILSPDPEWKEGMTTITILRETRSVNGYQLDNPFAYKINTALPDMPPPDSGAY